MKQQILIVDDEPAICDFLSYLLEDEGYETVVASDGGAAEQAIQNHRPDLILLDIGLPGESGLSLCRKYRRRGIPTVILTSHDQQDEIIEGLEGGAEDYIRKPYNNRELVLRIRKVLSRREEAPAPDVLVTGNLRLDFDRQRLYRDDQEVLLTPTEYGILACLARRRGCLVTWQEILKEVWHADQWEGGRELVKVNIRRLRIKIEGDTSKPRYILTHRGRGYLFPDGTGNGEELG